MVLVGLAAIFTRNVRALHIAFTLVLFSQYILVVRHMGRSHARCLRISWPDPDRGAGMIPRARIHVHLLLALLVYP
jgi:hypothetical protein